MAIKDTNPAAIIRVSAPKVRRLPETEASKPIIIEPYHVDLLPEYEYVSREYMISGIAAGESYCTRILLRCPADIKNFTGFVVEEPSHLWGGTSIWRHINRWLMRNGHAWLEVNAQSPSALSKLKNVDPDRYKDMHFIPGPLSNEFSEHIPWEMDVTKDALSQAYQSFRSQWWPATTQAPEIIAAASYALRSDMLGITAKRVVLSGLSQTGGVTRQFVTHSSHLRLPDGSLPLDGFIPCQAGGDALPDLPGAKIIELLGEAEFLSVRYPCGISGQMKGIAHRRPDSDCFRLYEVAGMAHRESRYASDLDLERWSVAELNGASWSTFSNSFIYHAVFEAMEKWTGDLAISPPPSALLETVGATDYIHRDEHGNAIGGVRSIHTDAPLSKIVAATPKGRPNWYWGSEWAFDKAKMKDIYGSVEMYRHTAGKALSQQMQNRFLLLADAETLRRETIEQVLF
ncbi:signal peptide-containing protein [Fusarium austroafricanum]|uniref:Signal peptide-containing protein n=1 Tax=Fusarium austroafricanum TaxID=2364996 RepID=A0A8H4NL93_9HYPO|nr:signal peptide-containing protein [Fusarium austroafricanum]